MNKIMFTGPSGIGKSTLAKWASEVFEIPFISGSIRDLDPTLGDKPHSSMLKDLNLQEKNMKWLNLRNKAFKNEDSFVSDRSYLDSAAYFMYELAKEIPQCEVEHFLEVCKMLLTIQCTHLIFLNFDVHLIKQWVTEDDNKRITNNFFQAEISSIMCLVLRYWGLSMDIKRYSAISSGIINRRILEYGATVHRIEGIHGSTKVLVLNEANIDDRKYIIQKFINE